MVADASSNSPASSPVLAGVKLREDGTSGVAFDHTTAEENPVELFGKPQLHMPTISVTGTATAGPIMKLPTFFPTSASNAAGAVDLKIGQQTHTARGEVLGSFEPHARQSNYTSTSSRIRSTSATATNVMNTCASKPNGGFVLRSSRLAAATTASSRNKAKKMQMSVALEQQQKASNSSEEHRDEEDELLFQHQQQEPPQLTTGQHHQRPPVSSLSGQHQQHYNGLLNARTDSNATSGASSVLTSVSSAAPRQQHSSSGHPQPAQVAGGPPRGSSSSHNYNGYNKRSAMGHAPNLFPSSSSSVASSSTSGAGSKNPYNHFLHHNSASGLGAAGRLAGNNPMQLGMTTKVVKQTRNASVLKADKRASEIIQRLLKRNTAASTDDPGEDREQFYQGSHTAAAQRQFSSSSSSSTGTPRNVNPTDQRLSPVERLHSMHSDMVSLIHAIETLQQENTRLRWKQLSQVDVLFRSWCDSDNRGLLSQCLSVWKKLLEYKKHSKNIELAVVETQKEEQKKFDQYLLEHKTVFDSEKEKLKKHHYDEKLNLKNKHAESLRDHASEIAQDFQEKHVMLSEEFQRGMHEMRGEFEEKLAAQFEDFEQKKKDESSRHDRELVAKNHEISQLKLKHEDERKHLQKNQKKLEAEIASLQRQLSEKDGFLQESEKILTLVKDAVGGAGRDMITAHRNTSSGAPVVANFYSEREGASATHASSTTTPLAPASSSSTPLTTNHDRSAGATGAGQNSSHASAALTYCQNALHEMLFTIDPRYLGRSAPAENENATNELGNGNGAPVNRDASSTLSDQQQQKRNLTPQGAAVLPAPKGGGASSLLHEESSHYRLDRQEDVENEDFRTMSPRWMPKKGQVVVGRHVLNRVKNNVVDVPNKKTRACSGTSSNSSSAKEYSQSDVALADDTTPVEEAAAEEHQH
ncbi:unnamed protein product [Amoebophrya sp. A120]|nr:unnamed protein product [Amoebophrya sp. A120]|eukprot:GSA120T00022043001.1